MLLPMGGVHICSTYMPLDYTCWHNTFASSVWSSYSYIQGPPSKTTAFPGFAISIFKIKQSWERLIFITGIHMLIRSNIFILKQPPGCWIYAKFSWVRIDLTGVWPEPLIVGKIWLQVILKREHLYVIFNSALQWRHNWRDSVSNHQPHDCLLNLVFRRRSKKTSKLRVSGLCAGNSPWPVNSPHEGPETRIIFQFDDVIMETNMAGAGIAWPAKPAALSNNTGRVCFTCTPDILAFITHIYMCVNELK